MLSGRWCRLGCSRSSVQFGSGGSARDSQQHKVLVSCTGSFGPGGPMPAKGAVGFTEPNHHAGGLPTQCSDPICWPRQESRIKLMPRGLQGFLGYTVVLDPCDEFVRHSGRIRPLRDSSRGPSLRAFRRTNSGYVVQEPETRRGGVPLDSLLYLHTKSDSFVL